MSAPAVVQGLAWPLAAAAGGGASWVWWLVLGIALVAAALAGVWAWRLYRSRENDRGGDAADQDLAGDDAQQPSAGSRAGIRTAFADVRRLLGSRWPWSREHQAAPWYLALGRAESGRTTLLESSGLPRRDPGPDFDELVAPSGCGWTFFGNAIVVTPHENVLFDASYGTRDARAWVELVKALTANNRERPLDAVVLAVPAVDLLPPEPVIGAAAARIRENLRILARQTGLRCPVYLAITRCDELDGFVPFARSLPSHFWNQMLGWSNPHELGEDFDPAWIDEGLDTLDDELRQLQLAVGATASGARTGEPFQAVRAAIAECGEGLRQLAAEVFRRTVYDDPPLLRGFYFTGDMGTASEPTPVASDVGLIRRPGLAFARGLLQDKVFAEVGLARVGEMARSARRRVGWAVGSVLGALLIFLLAGLLVTASRLPAKVRTLNPVLSAVGRSVEAGGPADPDGLRSRHLLDEMAEVDTGSLESGFMPTSLLSGMDERVERALGTAFERVILPTVHGRLRHDVERLIDRAEGAGAAGSVPGSVLAGAPVVEAAEMKQLERAVDGLVDLERIGRAYNGLAAPGSGDLHQLEAVVSHVFGSRLRSALFSEYSFYERALRRSVGPLLSCGPEERERVVRALLSLARPLLVGSLQADGVRDRLPLVAELFEEVEDGKSVEALREIAETLDGLDRFLKRANIPTELQAALPTGAGEDGADLAFGPALEQVRRRLERLVEATAGEGGACEAATTEGAGSGEGELRSAPCCLTREMARRLMAEARAEMAAMHTELIASGLVAAAPGEDRLVLLPEVAALGRALDGLLDQALVKSRPDERKSQLDMSLAYAWDADRLEELAAGVRAFGERLDEAMDGITPGPEIVTEELKGAVREAVLRRASAVVVGEVGQAAVFEGLTGPQAETGPFGEAPSASARFQEALASQDALIGALLGAGMDDAAGYVYDVVVARANEILRQLDERLDRAAPYGLDLRTSRKPGGDMVRISEVIPVEDVGRMRELADSARGTVAALAREEALPLVSVLEGRGVGPGSPLRAAGFNKRRRDRWRGIIDALDAYDEHKIGNSVERLESFLLSDLPGIAEQPCYSRQLLNPEPMRGYDWFLERKRRILRAILDECAPRAVLGARESFGALVSGFSRTLEGHFPFGSGEDAPARRVREVLEAAATFARDHRDAVESHKAFAPDRAEILDFVDRLAAVRTFFGGDAAAERPPEEAVTFDVLVERHRDRDDFCDGAQIAEWRLETGGNVLSSRGRGNDSIRWTVGEPVRFVLRWATGSKTDPLGDPTSPNARVDTAQRAVVYAFDGPWSLLHLLESQHSHSFESLEVGQVPLLFELLESNSGIDYDCAIDCECKVRARFRVTLRDPATKEALPIPEFPLYAPAVPDQQVGPTTGSN